MAIDWSKVEHFNFLDAACLFCGLDPNSKNKGLPQVKGIETDLRGWIAAQADQYNDLISRFPMMTKIPGGAKIQDPHPETISRESLLKYAKQRKLKPNFLFPNESELLDELHPNTKLSYLKLILALLKERNIAISDPNVATTIGKITARHLVKPMDVDTIKKIIEEIRTKPSLKASRTKR